MEAAAKPIANPLVVLREEFDDWAVLFDPDSGEAFGLNPVGVFVWKRLDGQHTAADIAAELQGSFEDVPPEAEGDVKALMDDLVQNGLAGYEAGQIGK